MAQTLQRRLTDAERDAVAANYGLVRRATQMFAAALAGLRRIGPGECVDGLLEDALMYAVATHTPQRGRLSTWYWVCCRRFFGHFREKWLRRQAIDRDYRQTPRPAPADPAAVAADRDHAAHLLSLLKPYQRSLFYGDVAAVAAASGRTRTGVATSRNKARNRLRLAGAIA